MYQEILEKQGTPGWLDARKRLKVTGSVAGTVVGHCPFKTPERFLYEYKNDIKTITNDAMLHGQMMEPMVREWYANKHSVTVRESGLIIPDFDKEIGGSLDGFVGEDGIIEIKCPKRMYDMEVSDVNPAGMPLYHYDQIQFYLMITGRKWCDYIVCVAENNTLVGGTVAEKRVLVNKAYWDTILYPGILKFKSML
jgi:putative phage-type endonuclease